MDAIELPLPVNVVVSKLLVAKGFNRITAEEKESRGVSILGNHLPASCSSSHGDITYAVHPSERNAVSKTEKMTDEDSNGHLSKERHNSFSLLPEYPGKQLRRKAVKVPTSSGPCVKRPRTDQLEDSTSIVGHGDNSGMCGKIVLTTAKCNSTEKSRLVKQKHGQDGKRVDKRNFRTAAKTKFDPLMSSSLINGGNNILGIYGLKSDIPDVTKHMEELSLKDIIDGRHKSPNPVQVSERKSTSSNEVFLVSVRKACSLLSLNYANHSGAADAADGCCDKKSAACRPSAGLYVANKKECYNNKDKVVAETSSSSEAIFSKLGPLENPRDIQGRLALPPVDDLNSFISQTPIPALAFLQRSMPQNASLSPFPWSLSPSGSFKANPDSCKLSASRNMYQQRWIRIGSNACYHASASSRFSDQDLRPDNNSVPSSELKFDGLPVICSPESSQVPNKAIFKSVHVMSLHHPSEPSFSEDHLEYPDKCHLKNDSEEHLPFLSLDTLDNITHRGNEEMCLNQSENCLLVQQNGIAAAEMENSKAITEQHTYSNCYIPSKLSFDECDQQSRHLHPAENSKHVGHSPRLLAAAQTLCEIASYYWSNGGDKQNHVNSKVRWPRKPSQKTMKAPRPRTSTGKTVEGFAVSAMPGDPVKSMGNMLSPKPKILMTDKKKNLIHINNVHKGPVKWLASSKYPPKLGGDPVAHTKQLNLADSVKLSVRTVLSTKEDRICNSRQQKLRKAVVADVPASNQVKDLVTRSRKE